MMTRAGIRNLVIGLGGLAIGAILLWLALRQFDGQEFSRALAAFDGQIILAACAVYWLGFVFRTGRWFILLRELSVVRWLAVAETLVAGYGANNLLPARLGELVRADYGKGALRLSRSTLLGTIVVERILDLTAVLACLFAGAALGAVSDNRGFAALVRDVSWKGVALIALVWLAIAFCRQRLRAVESAAGPRVLREVMGGISSLNVRTGLLASGLSVMVWLCEAGALWLVFRAFQVQLSIPQTVLLIGASSLSTLIPTAPGYVGSFQLVFVLAMAGFGIPETMGLVASAAIQIFLFGSITAMALVLYFNRWVRDLRRNLRTARLSAQENAAHG